MLTIAIQAGGESRRMGTDKGLALFLGQPLAQRVLARLAPIAQEMLLTTNRPEAYAFLGVACYPDLIPGRGALGGLYTALSAASQPLVGVVACDMPFASPALLAAASQALLESGADAAVPRRPGGLEPFHAVYRRQTCLPLIEAALQGDKWRVDAWFGQAQLRYIDEAECLRYDPSLRCFENVNTLEELAAAEATAAGSS